MVEHLGFIQIVIKTLKCTLYLQQTDTDGRESVLHEAGVEQDNITEAAPNELKLGEGGPVMRARHRQGGGVGGCSSGVV